MNVSTTTCEYCYKQFNKKSNYLRHIKSVHSRNSEGELVPRGKQFTCDFCNKEYFTKSSLDYHLRTIHLEKQKCCTYCSFQTSHKSVLIKHIKKHEEKSQDSQTFVKRFKCTDCCSSFLKESRLRSHVREKHKNYVCKITPPISKKCPLCPFIAIGLRNKEIYTHFKNSHNISLEWESHIFESLQEFNAWKVEVEKKTSSFFYKQTTYNNNGVLTYTYRCHRSGRYKSTSINKQQLKISRSMKINGFCPALMKTTIDDKGVQVSYLASHVGHKCELKYLRITKDERQSIAIQLATRKPHENTLKWIKSSVPNSELNRFHLTNKKDILNIEESLNLHDEYMKHPFDPVSIEAWVRELRETETTSLIVFKPQGKECNEYKLNENDFLLIFMTDTQKRMLLTYGHETICIDSTHRLNNCSFQLYTVLTVDDSHEGFPVAFMFSNRQDEHVMKIFFDSIKQVVGSMKIKVFMSDMEESFYAAWLQTMGPAEMRVFCSWHVIKAWKANVFSKIKNKAKQVEIFKTLKTLLYEIDKAAFDNLLEKTIKRFQGDEELKEFSKYFETNFNNRYTTWAYCYKIDAGVITNMSIENFNRILKYCYLKGKLVCRLDKTLCAILSLLRDKLFDILVKITRGKLVTKLKNLRTAHRRSLTINSDQITKNENKWQVLSSTQTFYTVRQIKNCKSCQLQCFHCESCFHEFVCSCLENSIRNNMCKHIHAVARHLKMAYDKPEMNSSVTENECGDEVLQEFVKDASTAERVELLEELKAKCCTDLQELLSIITNTDEIKYVLNEIKRTRTTVQARQPATSTMF